MYVFLNQRSENHCGTGGCFDRNRNRRSRPEPHIRPEIQLTAEKYDFKPDTVTVKKGDHVRLVITAIDHDHGFKIEAFQINQKLPKGQAVTVEFMADQVGTFSFQCSQFCGLGHKKMKGKLVVK